MKTLSSKIVFTCPIFQIEEAEVEFEDGTRQTHWYILKRPSVAVICVVEGKIIMMKEWRSATQSYQWRLPSGSIEEGETSEQAAIREVRKNLG